MKRIKTEKGNIWSPKYTGSIGGKMAEECPWAHTSHKHNKKHTQY